MRRSENQTSAVRGKALSALVLGLVLGLASRGHAQEDAGRLPARESDFFQPSWPCLHQEEAPRASEEKFPSPLGPLFECLNPARIHRRLDEALGLDAGEQSDKPRAPEIPVALFREVIRPLGALKYENELNYFVGTFSGETPTLQTLTSEYVFADWNAARLELAWSEGKLESIAAGYRHTLGVGPRHNWVHGFVIQPEFAVRGHFVGGTGIYTFAWKPEEESPWSLGLSAGADRASLAAFGRAAAASGGPESSGHGEMEDEERVSVWRPFLSANLWYSLSRSFTVGVENDILPHHRFGEYLVLPHLTWRPTEHFFVQVGAGYYQLGSDCQATFMVRANLLNPSPRKPREERESERGE